VCCGSFSPVTNLHLRLFEEARNALGPLVTHGFLSPVHDGYGKKGLVSAAHRLEMCRLATERSSWISVLPWETTQHEWIPTHIVLKELEAQLVSLLGEDFDLKLLSGGDLVESMRYESIWPGDSVKD